MQNKLLLENKITNLNYFKTIFKRNFTYFQYYEEDFHYIYYFPFNVKIFKKC